MSFDKYRAENDYLLQLKIYFKTMNGRLNHRSFKTRIAVWRVYFGDTQKQHLILAFVVFHFNIKKKIQHKFHKLESYHPILCKLLCFI